MFVFPWIAYKYKPTLEISELISRVFVNLATVIAGIWAVYNYFLSKRAEATRWVYELYNKFYSDEKFLNPRETLEYKYFSKLAPLMELRVLGRHIKLTEEERKLLNDMDMLFNFFENLIFLEEEGVIDRKDREVLFDYWFGQLNYPQRGNIRRYFDRCGYERLAKVTNSNYEKEYIGFTYETIEKLENLLSEIKLVKVHDRCRIHAFKDCDYKFKDLEFKVFAIDRDVYQKVFIRIDSEIGYNIRELNKEYTRICLRLIPLNKDVWVYIKSSVWKEGVGDCDS